jgi:hypothetical protein
MATSPNKDSYILDLETKKTEFYTLLGKYKQTKNTYLSLTRKFIITNNKAIRDPSNNLYTYKEESDTQEKCKDICVNDLECGAAVFYNKSCAIYKTYTDTIDSSSNYAITPDTTTVSEAIKKDIDSKKLELENQNTVLIAKINALIDLLKNPQYKEFRDEQSDKNKQYLYMLNEKKDILEKDRNLLNVLLDDVFNLTEEIKETKLSTDQNFYIQIVLSVITIILIFAAIYYLWPSSSNPPPPSLTNQFMPSSGMKPNNGLM